MNTQNNRWGHGPGPGGRHGFRHHFAQQKAPVSIYKTENTYEILVFAPGRVKENFSVTIAGDELTVGYVPTDDTSNLDWVKKEYSRGGFQRSFLIDTTVESEKLSAKYEDGVLKISLPVKAGEEKMKTQIVVS